MKVVQRKANLKDASQLFELRRASIVALAPLGMSATEANDWAVGLTVVGMRKKLHDMEIWVAEVGDRIVGWGAIRGDYLEGLYTDPQYAGRGIGIGLLYLLEGLMRERGISSVQADASLNAEDFYFRRGYERVGPRSSKLASRITKRL